MSTTPTVQPKQLAAQRGYKPKKSIKSPALQSKILTQRAIGMSKAKIAKDLQIDTRTVTNVLNVHDFDNEIAENQLQSMGLIPKAIRVAEHRLSQNSENMAIKVLENTIWPLNNKQGGGLKPGDNLFLSIQNLIQPPTVKPLESAIECVPRDTTSDPTKP